MEPLTRALLDMNSDVRMSAAEALNTLGWTPGRDQAAAAYWIGRGQWDTCVTLGEPAVEPLIKALNYADWSVRMNAAKALGTIGDSRAVEPLIRSLNDSDWGVRMSAARTLVRLYNDTRIDEKSKQAVLAQREAITTPHDDSYQSSDCVGHTDNGIGGSFPV